jgi:tetratricopeptide (TPR) repeat protein
MKTTVLIKAIWFLALVFCGLQNLTAQTNYQFDAEVNAAIASTDVRHRLISEYEAATNSFHDGRLFAVAVSYALEEKYAQAIPVYQQFLSAHPGNVRGLRGLGNCYLMLRQYDKAARWFEQAWSLEDTSSLPSLANSYLMLTNYDRMEQLLPSLLQYETNDIPIVYYLMCYANAKKPMDQALFLKALNGLSDTNWLAVTDIVDQVDHAVRQLAPPVDYTGVALPLPSITNELLKAIFNKMIRGYNLDPDSWPTNCLIGVAGAYFYFGEYTKARPVLINYLKYAPDNSEGFALLGQIDVLQERPTEAITHWRKAWQLGGVGTNVLFGLANLYAKRENTDGFKDLIPSLLALKHEDPRCAALVMGYAYHVEPRNPELFKQAIAGLTDEELLSAYTDTDVLVRELNAFDEGERATRILKLKAEKLLKK